MYIHTYTYTYIYICIYIYVINIRRRSQPLGTDASSLRLQFKQMFQAWGSVERNAIDVCAYFSAHVYVYVFTYTPMCIYTCTFYLLIYGLPQNSHRHEHVHIHQCACMYIYIYGHTIYSCMCFPRTPTGISSL